MGLRFVIVFGIALVSAGALGQETTAPVERGSREIPGATSRGRTAIAIPARTDAGRWTGTWIYVNRDYNFALWLNEDEGATVAKLRFKGNGNLVEAFETAWDGHAEYNVDGYPARFDFHLLETGPDVMTATWSWDLDFRGSGRREVSSIEMFRTGDGRQLVLNFHDFEKVISSSGGSRSYNLPQVWTFRKMSKRLVLWEELPF